MATLTLSTEVLDKLRTFDTPTICNIIELFEVRPRNVGYTDARIVAAYPDLPPMVGFAATATFRSAAPPLGGPTARSAGVPPRGRSGYSSVQDQVERFGELSGPAVVVFQDLDEPSAAATFGEVMCTTYQAFGAVGLITSGTGRDLDQVRALNFPVFTNGTICSHGYNHIPEIHVPVRVGGLTIYPDDLLHGDRNGVSTIPIDIAAEVADVGYEFAAAEAVVLEALRSGTPSIKAYEEARKEMGARVVKLRDQVSRAK